MGVVFDNRKQAGELLAEKLSAQRVSGGVVVGLPRGGVVVAGVVAHALHLTLDCLVVKKISSPLQPELGIGALAPDDVSYINWKLAHRVAADEDYITSQKIALDEEIKRKSTLYRKGKKPLDVRNKTVVLVDDGAATGATLHAAIMWLRKKKSKKIVVALPVAPRDVIGKIKPEVQEVIVLESPQNFEAVGECYNNFPQVGDEEVIHLLQ